ncbi:MAG: hypothetical protein SNH63_01775 [Rikenellaceae bacterium]
MKKFLLLSLSLATFVGYAQTQEDYSSLLERLEVLEAEVKSIEESSAETATSKSRLTLGGYGEVVMSRHFYSDSWKRYSAPTMYADDEGYGRVDIPHAVFFVGYDFGKGWSFGSEIEFEHGGLEVAVELEQEENGEYESEVENGGEIIMEQFWINKRWSKGLNLKMGHFVIPVGQTNKYHMPNEYFGVFRPEGESTIIPCAWHESGVSLWGRVGAWSYEAMVVAGLDAERFDSWGWIASSSGSPYEFKIANTYAGAVRIDNHSVKNLTLSASAYMGNSAANSLKDKYGSDVKGLVTLLSLDGVYRSSNLVARANVLYGTLGDSYEITAGNKSSGTSSMSSGLPVAKSALTYGGEVGYNLFSLFAKAKSQKLFIFGRYEFYDSMYEVEDGVTMKTYCARDCISGGLNYSPIPQVTIKAEYQSRIFSSSYNTENTLAIGVTYTGLFQGSFN